MESLEQHFDTLLERLPNCKRAPAFGYPCIKTKDGKIVAALIAHKGINFRLAEDEAVEALKLDGAQYFEPRPNIVMKNWVIVPLAQAEHYHWLGNLAFENAQKA